MTDRPGAAGGDDVFLALGANVGNPLDRIREAAGRLAAWFGDLQTAGVYRSAPEDGSHQPDFLNTVVRARSRRGASEILAFAHDLEARAGRVRTVRHGPRPLDVDLLFHGDLVCDTPHLTVPHPRWAVRPFVVVPLLDLAPDRVDPRTGRSVAAVAAAAGWDGTTLPRVVEPGALLPDAPADRRGGRR